MGVGVQVYNTNPAPLFRRRGERLRSRVKCSKAGLADSGRAERWQAAEEPPFTLRDIRNAIPDDCFERDGRVSSMFLLADFAVIGGLGACAKWIDHPAAWAAYAFLQGTAFWSLFVVGHDAGHGSYARRRWVNKVAGLIAHTPLGVPYSSWQKSHATHHANHGHADKEESWHPTPEDRAKEMDPIERWGRHSPLALLAFPVYLLTRSPGKEGSHFDPNSPLFHTAKERSEAAQSIAAVYLWVGALASAAFMYGLKDVALLYGAPWVVFCSWLDAVTYLHHHGPHDEEPVPWYRNDEWTFLRGALSSIDRDYGIFHGLTHDIGTHVIHHIFPTIPHYKLNRATTYAKPVLQSYYREPEKAPFGIPVQLIKPLLQSFANDHIVPKTGDVVAYHRYFD